MVILVASNNPKKLAELERILADAGVRIVVTDRHHRRRLPQELPATVLPIMFAAFAAYALAWMEFPGRALLTAADHAARADSLVRMHEAASSRPIPAAAKCWVSKPRCRCRSRR